MAIFSPFDSGTVPNITSLYRTLQLSNMSRKFIAYQLQIRMMPNRYMPSALTDMVEEKHEALLNDVEGKGDGTDGDDYVPEYKALVTMLKPEHQREFRERRGELDG